MMAGSGLKTCTKEKVTLCKQIAMHQQGAYMINAKNHRKSGNNISHIWKQVKLFYLSSHNNYVSNLGLIYLPNNMECVLSVFL
jgi:hypothetical protein